MRSASTVKKHLIYVTYSFFIAANPWVVLNIPKLKYPSQEVKKVTLTK
jgi:hypothetical protein